MADDALALHERFTPEELHAQYVVRASRPDLETEIIPGWARASEAARARLGGRIDTRYGGGEMQRLDLFPSGTAGAPLLVFFHGGYWQRGGKALYSFLADPFVAAGVDVALVGYDLCPSVTIARIVDEAREALAFLWREAGALGASRERITVMGHSAGGHLAQMAMATDWPAFGSDLPADLTKAGVPISPLSWLEPVRLTAALNDAIRMDAAEAKAQSPMTGPPPRAGAPLLVAAGGRETAEFHRQARMYVDAFAGPERPISLRIVPGVDHFDILDALADPGGAFFREVLALARGESGAGAG